MNKRVNKISLNNYIYPLAHIGILKGGLGQRPSNSNSFLGLNSIFKPMCYEPTIEVVIGG